MKLNSKKFTEICKFKKEITDTGDNEYCIKKTIFYAIRSDGKVLTKTNHKTMLYDTPQWHHGIYKEALFRRPDGSKFYRRCKDLSLINECIDKMRSHFINNGVLIANN